MHRTCYREMPTQNKISAMQILHHASKEHLFHQIAFGKIRKRYAQKACGKFYNAAVCVENVI
jgi:hypothetical protein